MGRVESNSLGSHTHTHAEGGGREGRCVEERPKYDKERRGRGGIEPHLERQTTASPKSQGSRDEREREREAACVPLGEQALSLAACFCFITGLVVEYGISDRLYPKSRPQKNHNSHSIVRVKDA